MPKFCRRWTWCILAIACVGCQSDSYTKIYSMEFQESIALDPYVSLIFYDVIQDSRCPVNVNCIDAGKIEITLAPLYYDALGNEIHLVLDPTDSTLAEIVVADDYAVTLLNVIPQPDTSVTVELDAYVAELEVRRL